MSDKKSVEDVVNEIQYWLRLASLQHGAVKTALLKTFHNSGCDHSYTGAPEDPSQLYTYLDVNYRTVLDNLPRRVLSTEHYQLIFPPGRTETYSDKFDITLLAILIQNCTDLAPAGFNWRRTPHPNDTSKAAYVVRAREWRNWVNHTEPNVIDVPTFESKWKEGVDVAKALGLRSFDYASLKTTSIDPKNALIFSLLKGLQNETLNSVLKTSTTNAEDIELLRIKCKSFQEQMERLEKELSESRKIKTRNQGKLHNIALPEVIAIVKKHLSRYSSSTEDWKEKLFNYNQITWAAIKNGLKYINREDIKDKIRRKRIFKQDGDDIKLNEDTEKVLLAEIKDNEKCKKIIDNWTARIHRNEEEQRMPGKCWWKCLKKELPRNKRNVVVMAIKDRTLLTPRVFINDTEFRQYVRSEVLEIIKDEIGDSWDMFMEDSPLYNYLSLAKDFIKWSNLRDKLEKFCQYDKDASERTYDEIYEIILKEIREDTLLTYGIQNATLKLKKMYSDELVNIMIKEPIFDRIENPYNNVPREEAYVDLAIIKEKRTADWLLKAPSKSDGTFHLDLQSMDKEIIPMEKVFESNDSFVVLRGIGGIGKSTFVDTYSLKWAKTKLLTGIKFLFRFKCRELNNDKLINVATLLKSKYLKTLGISFKDLEEISSSILILVDGLDEFKEMHYLREWNGGASTLRDLLSTKGELRGHKTIVAARPEACREIQYTFGGGMKRDGEQERIKVVDISGFSNDSIITYIDYFFRKDPKIIDVVYSKLKGSPNLLAMARIPVYLWVICCMYLNNVTLEKVNTNTQLCIYTCLFFMKKHSIAENKVINVDEINTDIIKMVIALADLSMLGLFNKQQIFTIDDIRRSESTKDIRNPEMCLQTTGFLETNGSSYQFKHLILQQFFCGVCIFLTGCFKEYTSHPKFLKECLPIIAGLASIEKSGIDGDGRQDDVLITFVERLKDFSRCSRWKPSIFKSFLYGRSTIEQYISEVLNRIVANDRIIIDKNASDLLSVFNEYQHELNLSCFKGKKVFISDLIFHHDILNTINFLTKCDIYECIQEMSFTDLSSSNLIGLLQQFLKAGSNRESHKVLKISGNANTSCLASVRRSSRKGCIKDVHLVLQAGVGRRNPIDRCFLSSLCAEVDKVIIYKSIGNLYEAVKETIKDTNAFQGTLVYDVSEFSERFTKFSVCCTETLSSHTEFYNDAIKDWCSTSSSSKFDLLEHIHIKRNIFIDRGVSNILPYFRDVNISGNTSLGGYHFLQFLEHIPKQIEKNQFFIKSINLSNCDLQHYTMKRFLPYITQFEIVDLSNNLLFDDSLNKLIDFIRDKGPNSRLRDLKMVKTCPEISNECFLKFVTNCFLFRNLDISQNQVQNLNFRPRQSITELYSAEQFHSGITLNLGNCNLTDKYFDYLLPIFLKVSHLDLSHNVEMTEISLLALEKQLRRLTQQECGKDSSVNLKHLNVSGCFGQSDVYSTLKYCFKYLIGINFQHNFIPPIEFSTNIITSYSNKLSELSISLFKDHHWDLVAPCIPQLIKFDLRTSVPPSCTSAEVLVKHMKQSRRTGVQNLKYFGLHGCTISDAVMKVLFPTFIQIPNLNFSGVKLSIESLHEIYKALSPNTRRNSGPERVVLDSIDLSNCGLKDDHMRFFTSSIVHVKHSDLHKNAGISSVMIKNMLSQLENELEKRHVFTTMNIGNYKVSRRAEFPITIRNPSKLTANLQVV